MKKEEEREKKGGGKERERDRGENGITDKRTTDRTRRRERGKGRLWFAT